MKRIDVPPSILDNRRDGDEIELPDDPAHYVSNVLRMRPDDRLELFDGTGRLVVARVVESRDDVSVEILEHLESNQNESPLEATLYQAIPKGKRWKWLLQKATELGVDQIVPLETRHTVVQIPDDRLARKSERWNKIVSKAARQSRRTIVPSVIEPRSVEEALDGVEAGLQIVPYNTEERDLRSLSAVWSEADDSPDSVGIWIGPEGGFTDGEVDGMTDRDVRPVSLGPRVLRSETAGITALTLAQSTFGDL